MPLVRRVPVVEPSVSPEPLGPKPRPGPAPALVAPTSGTTAPASVTTLARTSKFLSPTQTKVSAASVVAAESSPV